MSIGWLGAYPVASPPGPFPVPRCPAVKMASRPHHLLFVCTANICRSPMAAGAARDYVRRRGWDVDIDSAGIMGLIGRPAHPLAVKVMGEVGVDVAPHRSKGVTEELVEWADYILVMELQHQIKLHREFPASENKVLMLGTFGGTHEIRDPIGGWRWRFRGARDQIVRSVQGFVDQLPPKAAD